jgi:hypothetical protein
LSLSSQKYGFGIRDPEKTYSGSRIQGSKRHPIPEPDPQHWIEERQNCSKKVFFFYFIEEDPTADPEGFSYKPESSLIDVNEALMDIFDANFCRKQYWSGSISVLDPDSAKLASDYCTLITFR